MNWKECPVLKQTAKEITRRGGVPVKMLLAEEGPVRLAVIVSHDPSGPNHAREFHASVSASTAGVRREPSAEEILNAGQQLRLPSWETSFSADRMTVHLWSPL
jgi:hypothetical protein